MKLNRREILKLVLSVFAAPVITTAKITEKVCTALETKAKPPGRNRTNPIFNGGMGNWDGIELYNYALQNMRLTDFIGDNTSIIQVERRK